MIEQRPADANKELERDIDQVNILLEAGLRTFNWTVERSRHFDIKASIFLAFLGILLLPSLEIYGWSNRLLWLRLSPIVLVFAGIVLCLYAILPTVHLQHPPLSALLKRYDNGKEPLDSKLELFRYYKSAASRNECIGKRKVTFIQVALVLSFCAFVIIILQYILRECLYGR